MNSSETEVCYFRTGADGKPEKVKTEIPMLFVQEENIDTCAADFKEKNGVTAALQPKMGHTAVTAAYNQYVTKYAADKGLVELSEIETFLGTKNSFFNEKIPLSGAKTELWARRQCRRAHRFFYELSDFFFAKQTRQRESAMPTRSNSAATTKYHGFDMSIVPDSRTTEV